MYAAGLSGFISGVTAQVYPLKANIARLQAFCDAYLNFTGEDDRPPVYFRAALPYVLLGILNYPRMTLTAHNMGWLSQHEIVFEVPLEWYAVENGRLVFKDWAVFAPFIYVDNPLSIEGGREVYGWPKAAVQLLPVASAGAPASRFFAVGIPEGAARSGGRLRTLLELEREPGVGDSLSAISPALARSASALWGPLEALSGAPVFGYEQPRDVRNLLAMARRGLSYAGSLLPGLLLRRPEVAARGPIDLDSPFFSLNCITLKQFRDAQEPELACYQALVRSKMVGARFNDGGPLFGLLPADLTGGISVRLHRLADQPIVESLGLEVIEETAHGDAPVATLRPAFPYWLNVDLGYSSGEVLSWRTAHGSWRFSKPAEPPTQQPPHRTAPAGSRYNTALGKAIQEIPGPFDYPNATVRVLPLMADAERLAQFCRNYLDNERYRFEPWGSYAYLLLTNIEELSSETDPFSLRAVRDAAFALPVKWYDARGNLLSVAIVSPFAYINSETAVITVREVSGLSAIHARIEAASRWIRESGAGVECEPGGLLTIKAMIFPALDLGAEARECTLIEIRDEDPLPAGDQALWDRVAGGWGRELIADYWRKHEAAQLYPDDFANLCALALEIMANGECLGGIGLKQFRDVAHFEYACYQALVLNRRYIDDIHSLEEDDSRKLHLRIHRYAMQPIVELLGLKVKWTETGGEVPVDILQPVRPFWAKLAIRERLGKNVCWRAATQWQYEAESSPLFFERGERRTRVGRRLVAAIDSSPEHKRHIKTAAHDWLRATLAAELRRLVQELKAAKLAQLVDWLELAPGADTAAAKRGPERNSDSQLRAALGSLTRELHRVEELAASEEQWQGFMNLFVLEGLLELADRLEAAAASAGLVDEKTIRERIAPQRLGCDEAARAVERIEPQMALERILSHEWQHCGAARWWRRLHKHEHLEDKPDFAIRADSIGASAPVTGWPPAAPLERVQPGLYAAAARRPPASRKRRPAG